MASKILYGAEETSGSSSKHFGKFLRNMLTSHDRNTLAVVDIVSGKYYTYGDLCEFSENLASNLKNIGIEKNCVMGLVSENSRKICVVFLASLYLMAPLHFFNSKFTQYELQQMLELTCPKLVFCSTKTINTLLAIKNNLKFLETIVLLDEANESKDFVLYDSLIKKRKKKLLIKESTDWNTQTALICNSSGSTGLPKGVMITHQGLQTHLVLIKNGVVHLTPAEYVPIVLPLFHVYGLSIMNCIFYSGSTMLLIDQFNPDIFLHTIQKYKVRRLFLVPYLVIFLLNSSFTDRYDLSSLTEIYTSGSTALEEEKQLLKTKLNLEKIFEIYGLTEASGPITASSRNKTTPKGSCGKVLSGRELKILDVDTHCTLGPYQNGEICVKNGIMKGYVSNNIKIQDVLEEEGFLRTGDLGYYDDKSFVYIIGRLKNIIKYKSLQVSPEQIEDVLAKHPLIKDVAVVGKCDRKFGEVAVGFIVKKEGAELNEETVLKYLAQMVCPEKWLHGGVRFVTTIPRNCTGKILRTRLQELL